jgi:hypothetical protein
MTMYLMARQDIVMDLRARHGMVRHGMVRHVKAIHPLKNLKIGVSDSTISVFCRGFAMTTKPEMPYVFKLGNGDKNNGLRNNRGGCKIR